MLTNRFLNLFTGKLALTNFIGLTFMLANLCNIILYLMHISTITTGQCDLLANQLLGNISTATDHVTVHSQDSSFNPLKRSDVRQLHLKVFSGIQIQHTFLISDIRALCDSGAQDIHEWTMTVLMPT